MISAAAVRSSRLSGRSEIPRGQPGVPGHGGLEPAPHVVARARGEALLREARVGALGRAEERLALDAPAAALGARVLDHGVDQLLLEAAAAQRARREDRAHDHARGIHHVVAVRHGPAALRHHAAGEAAALDPPGDGRSHVREVPAEFRVPERGLLVEQRPQLARLGLTQGASSQPSSVCSRRPGRTAGASRRSRRVRRNSTPARKLCGPGGASPSIDASATRPLVRSGPSGSSSVRSSTDAARERGRSPQQAADAGSGRGRARSSSGVRRRRPSGRLASFGPGDPRVPVRPRLPQSSRGDSILWRCPLARRRPRVPQAAALWVQPAEPYNSRSERGLPRAVATA